MTEEGLNSERVRVTERVRVNEAERVEEEQEDVERRVLGALGDRPGAEE